MPSVPVEPFHPTAADWAEAAAQKADEIELLAAELLRAAVTDSDINRCAEAATRALQSAHFSGTRGVCEALVTPSQADTPYEPLFRLRPAGQAPKLGPLIRDAEALDALFRPVAVEVAEILHRHGRRPTSGAGLALSGESRPFDGGGIFDHCLESVDLDPENEAAIVRRCSDTVRAIADRLESRHLRKLADELLKASRLVQSSEMAAPEVHLVAYKAVRAGFEAILVKIDKKPCRVYAERILELAGLSVTPGGDDPDGARISRSRKAIARFKKAASARGNEDPGRPPPV